MINLSNNLQKIILIIFLSLFFCNISSAEDYYFKGCKIDENLSANYLINFDENIIEVELSTQSGESQKLYDKIKSIEKDSILSALIQSGSNSNSWFQYHLDIISGSVIKQRYKKEGSTGLLRLFGPKEQSYCLDVKADWDKKKLEEIAKKKQAEIKEEEEKRRIEEEKRKAELERKKAEERKEKEKDQDKILINSKKWIKLSKYNSDSGKKLKVAFDKKAAEICNSPDNYNVLEKTVKVVGMDETPAFGTETKILLGIEGAVLCK